MKPLGSIRIGLPVLLLAASLAVAGVLTVLLANFSGHAESRMARGYGEALAAQVAAMATEPVIAADLASLSAMVGRIAENPAVASVSVSALDGRLLAGSPLGVRSPLVFVGQIEFEDTVVGQVRVVLEPRAFGLLGASAWFAWSMAIVVLATAAALLGRALGERFARPVEVLTRRAAAALDIEPPDAPDVPGACHLLAELEAKMVDEGPGPVANAVTLINLFDHRSAGGDDAAHAAAIDVLERVASLYGGEVEVIRGGALLAWCRSDSESVFQGICAAVLAARLMAISASGEFRIGIHTLDEDTPVDGQLVREAVALSSFAGHGEIALSSCLVRALAPNDERLELSQVAGTTWQALNRHSDSAWLLGNIAPRFEALLESQQAQLVGA